MQTILQPIYALVKPSISYEYSPKTTTIYHVNYNCLYAANKGNSGRSEYKKSSKFIP